MEDIFFGMESIIKESSRMVILKEKEKKYFKMEIITKVSFENNNLKDMESIILLSKITCIMVNLKMKNITDKEYYLMNIKIF